MKRALITGLLMAALTVTAGEVIKRGAPLSDAKPTPLAEVLANPDSFKGKTILVEGVISTVCQDMGCWMQLAPEGAKETMQVKFKDHAFFIPKDAKGVKARAEGVAEVKVLSKEDADHLESEGAALKRNSDGTVSQVSFIAAGVELTR